MASDNPASKSSAPDPNPCIVPPPSILRYGLDISALYVNCSAMTRYNLFRAGPCSAVSIRAKRIPTPLRPPAPLHPGGAAPIQRGSSQTGVVPGVVMAPLPRLTLTGVKAPSLGL